jgi:hypothetical protein
MILILGVPMSANVAKKVGEKRRIHRAGCVLPCHGGGKRKTCVAAGNLSVQLSTTMYLSGVLDHPHCSGLSTPAISTMMHWKLQTFSAGLDQGLY